MAHDPATQRIVRGLVTSASPGNILERLNLKPHLRLTNSESAFEQHSQVIHVFIKVWKALT